jgi:hypothetical protein
MTREEMELLESCHDAYVRLSTYKRDIAERDAVIRRLINYAGQPLVQDQAEWDAAVADAEKLLGGGS